MKCFAASPLRRIRFLPNNLEIPKNNRNFARKLRITKAKMASNDYNWTVGEIVTLPRKVRTLKTSGTTSYMQCIGSRFICIRESETGQRGILLKVLGKAHADRVTIEGGEPFARDDFDEQFNGDNYYSYPFPSSTNLKEVLDILRGNEEMLHRFEKASMHINPNSTFWVSDTTRNRLMIKKPQIYNAYNAELSVPNNDTPHYRVAIVFFYKNELYW